MRTPEAAWISRVRLTSVRSLNFDGLPQLDLGQILSGLTLNVSEDGMQELASSLMEGYQGYASEHPEADYSHLQEDFVSYINSTEAQEILRRHIQTIIAGGGVSITGTDPGTHSADLQRVSGIPDQDGLHRSGTV